VTVINSGRRTEEGVRVQFAPGFTYTIVASGTAGLDISEDGVLNIDRLAPKQDVTLVLIAEGGEFRKEHVLGVSSKETVGTVKSSIQEAQATTEQALIVLGVLFLLIFPIGYGVGKFVETVIWPEFVKPAMAAEESDTPLKFSLKPNEISGSANMTKKNAEAFSSTFHVLSATRKGDLVVLQIEIDNTTGERLSYTFSLSSPVSEKRSESGEVPNYIVTDVVAFPGANKTVELSDYLPADTEPQILILESRVDDADADRAWRNVDVILE